MTVRQWPWPGDGTIIRARKTALAYRNVAQELHATLRAVQGLYKRLDPRVKQWEPDEDAITTLDALLAKIDDPVRELDERIKMWGEDWHAEVPVTHHEDDLVGTEEAATILCVTRNTVDRMRNRGRISARLLQFPGDHGKRWYYLVGDLYKLQNEVRTRSSRKSPKTDKVHSDGSGDPK